MDLTRLGMAGHSFGAATTQAVGGEWFPTYGTAYMDGRVKAALAMSPAPALQGDNARAFGAVMILWMLMTGTEDHAPSRINRSTTAAARLAVYAALPVGGKYKLVLDQAEHGAFADRALPGEHEARNPNHHRAVLALSTAFWDAFLCHDPAARKWLDGSGPRQILESGNRWERK